MLLLAFQQILKYSLQLPDQNCVLTWIVCQAFRLFNLCVHPLNRLLELSDDQVVNIGQAQDLVEGVVAFEHEYSVLVVKGLQPSQYILSGLDSGQVGGCYGLRAQSIFYW